MRFVLYDDAKKQPIGVFSTSAPEQSRLRVFRLSIMRTLAFMPPPQPLTMAQMDAMINPAVMTAEFTFEVDFKSVRDGEETLFYTGSIENAGAILDYLNADEAANAAQSCQDPEPYHSLDEDRPRKLLQNAFIYGLIQ